MPETIKGISVVIEGDTTGLSKALADVNKATRDTQSELKQVDKLLKLDPSNTELLAQKQQLLTNAVESTKEKLDRLKAAQEQVNQQFANGEINEGQYRAFQREIVATEQSLEQLEERLRSSNPALESFGARAQEVSEKLSEAGEKVKGVGEKMSVAITAPIAAAGGLMLKGAIDAQNAQGKLQASLGLTADAAADLEAVAEAVWTNGFGENIDEVNDVISTVRKNIGDLAEDDMQKVAEGAMTISEVFGADVTDSTKAAGTMMKNFGISGQDALDLITVGFQKGGDYSGELLDTLNEYSPQFKSMGLSADQMMGVLISGAQAGAFNLDKVGDAVKEFNIRAQDGSKTTEAGFAAIGLNAQQMGEAIAKGGEDGQKAFMATVAALASMKDPIAQNTAGTELFGTQWEDVRSKVIVAMADGVKGIGEFKGATDEAASAMRDNNPGLALTKALREVQAAIGPALLPLADIIKNTVAPAIKSLADSFANLSPSGQKAVLVIAGIAAAIGPVLVVIGTLISTIGSITGAFATASGAISAAGGVIALITGPIGIAIAIITALAAAAYLIISNWGSIKEFFSDLWNSITTSITSAWEGIKQFLSDISVSIGQVIIAAWDGIGSFFESIGQTISDSLQAIWNEIKSTAEELWNSIVSSITGIITGFTSNVTNTFQGLSTGTSAIFDGIANYFTGIWDVIKNVFLGALLLIVDLVTGNFTELSTDAQAIWNNLKDAFGQIWTGIQQVFSGSLDAIKGLLSLAWETITNSVKTSWDAVKNYFENLWNDITSTASGAWDSFKTLISNTITGIIDGWENIFTGIKDFLPGLWEGIKGAAQNAWDEMGNLVSDIISREIEGWKTIFNGLFDFFAQLPEKMYEYGADIIQGLINGIATMISKVGKVVGDLADTIKSKIRGALGIASPSKVMIEIGEFAGQGLIDGMKSTISEISRQAQGMADAAVPSILPINGAYSGNTTGNQIGALLHADQVVIANDMDIQELANKLGFYWQQAVTAKGG